MRERLPGFRGEYLWELEIAVRQLTALADGFPEDKYSWKPAEKARSVSEVFVHLAVGNFMLLDLLGVPAPGDLYPEIEEIPPGADRFAALVRGNDEMDRAIRDKEGVRQLLARSCDAVRRAMTDTSDFDLERTIFFFREQTTVRRGFLRALVHMHEHMGQLTGYIRMLGLPAPWPDWRPDRR